MIGDRQRDFEIFAEAVRLPMEQRPAFLERAFAGDASLRQRVEALLQSNDRAGDFLEIPPTGSIDEGRVRLSSVEKPGDWVGRYKLLQQIGEGGCGVVFVAEQSDSIRRRVALKLVKPGMDTKSVIARFEAERQVLALMDHPNIADVFDAGASAMGRPYFVMELVDGVKITDYCDRHALSTSARLSLFMQVCEAIQHAHQKGIIHRDIKPSNVLVTTGHDGRPVPKVIDFGIAKATDGQQWTDKTIFTGREMVIGTPAYMSPEQAALTSTDMDTRTDIYSLGVLLYELLTGTTPFDTGDLLKAGFDEVRRVIRDEEPVRPSTRLRTILAADPARAPKLHGVETHRLIRAMRGDLDWIVMQALEKDRTRRYATANGLAMDVGRYLAGEGVLARPPSLRYKFRKLVGRNRLLFSGIALVFALLVFSLVATTRWLIAERHANEQMRQDTEISRYENLGWEGYYDHKLPEAVDNLRRALVLRRKYAKPNFVSMLLCQVTVIDLLTKSKRLDEIRPFFDEIVDPALLAKEGYREVYELGAVTLARHGRWEDAIAIAEYLQKAGPTQSSPYHLLAPLLVMRGDEEGYRRLCQEIVARFSDTTDGFVADKMAKDCLILPSAGVDLKAVAAMAGLAADTGTKWAAAPFFRCCKALAEYRLGHYEAAIDWALLAAQGQFPQTQAEAAAILAMSHFKLNHENQAWAALVNCHTVIEEKLPRIENEQSDLGQDWRDWIIAHALQKEAEALLNGSPPH